MNPGNPHLTSPAEAGLGAGQRFNRRRLFELGGAAAAMAAVLAACGSDSGGDPGRVGLAPAITDLPDEVVDDAVLLRTLQSLEYSILAVYERLSADAGLEGADAAALERFTADNTAAAEEFGALVSSVDGEPYACPNSWYDSRFFAPAITNVFGGSTSAGEVPVSDDIPRDARTLIQALEALSTASALHFVPKLSTPELRGAVIAHGAKASRRSATATLLINPGPDGYVTEELILADGGEVDDTADTAPVATETPETTPGGSVVPVAAPIPLPYVISARFAQLTAINIEVGAVNELGLRYKSAFETPADNAYVYNSYTCTA